MAFSIPEPVENAMLDFADAIDGNKYISSIKDAFTAYVPFIVSGSFGTLFTALISSSTTGLAQWVPALSTLGPAFSAMSFCTISCMTLPIVYLIAMNLSKREGLPEHLAAVLALCSYIAVVPNSVSATIESAGEVLQGAAAGLPSNALGAQGLFVGMIVAVVVVKLFALLTRVECIKIKMPDSVPAGIAVSFNTLIPVFIVILCSSLFGVLFQAVSGAYINEWLYLILQRPLETLFNSPMGVVFMALISQLFWLLGIHGGLIIEPIRSPLSAAALAANIAAVQAGLNPENPLTRGFWTVFVVAGGAGLTFSLILSILAFSKRDDQRAIAKLAFLPGVCGIGEPMVFGFPLVLNPVFAIPFIINSALAAGIGLLAINTGFIACSTVDAPFGLPLFVNAMLSFGPKGALVQLAILVVGFLVWTPCVLMSNRLAEKENEKASSTMSA